MHLSESAGDLGPGSILKVWAEDVVALTNIKAVASERMIDLAKEQLM
jgi:TusA-related sulfurtransferase